MGIIHNNPKVNKQFNTLLIQSYGTIVSSLIKYFGESSFEHVQNVTNNSFKKFKSEWSKNGIPENPENRIWNDIVNNTNKLFCKKIEYLHKKNKDTKLDINNLKLSYPTSSEAIKNQIELIFCIIDSKIDNEVKKHLLLNVICGFTYSKIARIFNKSEKTIEEKLYKEKIKIINHEIYFKIQKRNFDIDKQNLLIAEIKNIFDIGLSDKNVLSHEICLAATTLGKIVVNFPKTQNQELIALLSWMLFQLSRLDAMYDENGNTLNLKEQNRNLWNRNLINEGLEYLHKSASGNNISRLHLEAGVSAIHSISKNYISTDWNKIIALYDNYLAFNYSPIVELERAIAISKQNGPEKGIIAIKNIKDLEILNNDDLLYSTLGNLHLQLHKYEDALLNFEQAINLSDQTEEKSFYSKKIKICQQRIDMSKRYQHSLSF
ncbi:MAG: hypothetical protein GTO02_12755 [Candidatus Dadabacteria bacterium]|nr:hypothetical protein [Candidatus Dadabacteria bacterium]NIQ15220.1 hypothetical protein [Candidatus Dadabacteria bacterium]